MSQNIISYSKNIIKNKTNMKKYSKIFGSVGAVTGFISDFLQPLAPVAYYVFFIAIFASLILLVLLLFKTSLIEKGFPVLVCSLSILFFTGTMYAFQGLNEDNTGTLAGVIPGISSLQSAIGIMQEDIAELKETTQRIEKATTEIIGTLSEIQESFSNITQSGGIISNPTRPEQFYHNARVQEQGGDYGNARKSYNQYFKFKLDFLDPHIRYQTFLKIQEGKSGAREIYSLIYENDKRPIIEFARILLFDAPKRTEMLNAFISNNPDFAPAFYELSREFSEIRKGTQSLTDKKNELLALKEFEKLRNEGKFLKFFVDKELASKWITDVETRLKALSIVEDMSENSPITYNAFPTNQSWQINLSFNEPVRSIEYKLDGESEFKSTGLLDFVDTRTGAKMPKPMINLPLNSPETLIIVKYVDINKNEQGPFEIKFSPKRELALSMKKRIVDSKLNWISFREYPKDNLIVYFGMLSTRCGLNEIKYGVDKETPDQFFKIESPCDPLNPNAYRGNNYINLPLSTKFISVQITYSDGTKSTIEKFSNPHFR